MPLLTPSDRLPNRLLLAFPTKEGLLVTEALVVCEPVSLNRDSLDEAEHVGTRKCVSDPARLIGCS